MFKYLSNFIVLLLVYINVLVVSELRASTYPKLTNDSDLILGSEQGHKYLPLLKNKRVGLVANQTSVIFKATNEKTAPFASIHLVDYLLSHNIDLTVLFAPEHGVRGNKGAGEHIENGRDSKTQIPIQSIYGKNKTPPKKIMQALDVIIFDIQDVGARFYTYISSMHYVMEAAAKHKVSFIVLDRPNPNGEFIDGPVLDLHFQSFVGMHPIPVLHGLTVGELALMIKGEKWIKHAEHLDLTVVPIKNYKKTNVYIPPIPPSPNLPNYQAIRLYPSLCFFEPTEVSIGRGTPLPFQVTGHESVHIGSFPFTPISMPNSAPSPKRQNIALKGADLREGQADLALWFNPPERTEGLQLTLFVAYFEAFKQTEQAFFIAPDFMDKLAGTDQLRLALENGMSLKAIRKSWQNDLQAYKSKIEPYLLYPQ